MLVLAFCFTSLSPVISFWGGGLEKGIFFSLKNAICMSYFINSQSCDCALAFSFTLNVLCIIQSSVTKDE